MLATPDLADPDFLFHSTAALRSSAAAFLLSLARYRVTRVESTPTLYFQSGSILARVVVAWSTWPAVSRICPQVSRVKASTLAVAIKVVTASSCFPALERAPAIMRSLSKTVELSREATSSLQRSTWAVNIASKALFLLMAALWEEVSFSSRPSTVAALILFLLSKMFWSLLMVSKLLL